MCWTEYIPNIIEGGATIMAAGLAIGGGVWGFFRQKEYELVQRRYLEEGLDVVISTAENALNTYSHNWARCLELLKAFRDTPAIKSEELEIGFLHLPTDRFALTANYRTNQIVGSPVVWQVFQLIISFSQYGCSIARDEIPAALKIKLTTNDISESRTVMVAEAKQLLQELDKKSHRFQIFIGCMQDIVMLLESQKFKLKEIRKLRSHATVTAALKKLEEEFASELSPYNQQKS